jgi:hypothetical protein
LSLRSIAIAAVISSTVAAAGAGYLVWNYKDGQEAKLKLSYASAMNQAWQRGWALKAARDKVSHDADVKYAESHQKIVTLTNTIIREVPAHVSEKVDRDFPVACGVIRVWDAATLGVSADQLPLPAGKSDDSTCPVKASALAQSGAAAIRGYAEISNQLTSLQDWAKDEGAVKTDAGAAPTSP